MKIASVKECDEIKYEFLVCTFKNIKTWVLKMPLNAYIVKHIFKIKVEGIYSFILNPAVHTTAFVLEYFKYIGIWNEIFYP